MDSQELFMSAKEVFPGGVNSPVRSFKYVGGSPIYFESANGAYLKDIEGNSYIDFCMAFGPHLLGHSPASVVDAVQEQAKKGFTYGACHPGEVELARLILKSYPFLQKTRLVTSGTEAVMTAIRLARGSTGRNKILRFEGSFHGHSDSMLAKAGSGVAQLVVSDSKGVPPSLVQDTIVSRYDSLTEVSNQFRKHQGEIAAIIMEPIPANYGLWIPQYEHIRQIVELARANGALVIFDEVITGFRVGSSGATGFFDLRPDLVTLGKVIGGGLPLAAVVGKGEIMDLLAPVGEVYQSGTMAGNALAVAAGIAALTEIHSRKLEWTVFDRRCEQFRNELERILKRDHDVHVKGLGSIFWINFGSDSKAFPQVITKEASDNYAGLFNRALKEGIYLPPSPYEVCFLSFAHDERVLVDALLRFDRCSSHPR